MSDIEDLLEAAQANPLLARVDGLAGSRDWDALIELARRCREAVERGKQLWPIAEYIDYRLALEAPGPVAATVLTPEAGRFALGPLTEVAASTHAFAELAPHIGSPQAAGYTAAERVVRGEDLRRADRTHPEILEMPLALMDWEPAYPLASYKASDASFEDYKAHPKMSESRSSSFEVLEDDEIRRALTGLVDPWISQSNGHVEVTVVDGSSEGAIAALGFDSFRIGKIDPAEALEVMAWAAASGGARGKRRGAAYGRFAAWWTGSVLGDIEWPPSPDELWEAVSELNWSLWVPLDSHQGWNLHLAVASPDGWASAVAANDQFEEEGSSLS